MEELCIQTDTKWQSSGERQRLIDLIALKESGQMEAYYQQSQELIGELKKDYKRQTKS